MALLIRSVPFEYRAQLFEDLYGRADGAETEAVGEVQVEKSVMDQMREMRDRAAARRESRTEPDAGN